MEQIYCLLLLSRVSEKLNARGYTLLTDESEALALILAQVEKKSAT
jgi:hypothetical protein